MAPGDRAVYGGFWLRACAYLVDALILGVANAALVFAGALVLSIQGAPAAKGVLLVCIVALVVFLPFVYFAELESSTRRATPGKRLFGLVVQDLGGDRISSRAAYKRSLAKLLPLFVPLLGQIWVILSAISLGSDHRKQAFHDRWAGTVVVEGQGVVLSPEPGPRIPQPTAAEAIDFPTLVKESQETLDQFFGPDDSIAQEECWEIVHQEVWVASGLKDGPVDKARQALGAIDDLQEDLSGPKKSVLDTAYDSAEERYRSALERAVGRHGLNAVADRLYAELFTQPN